MIRAAVKALIALSFIGGAALYLCPEGGTKRILKLLLTAVLISAVIMPLQEMDYDQLTLQEARLNRAEAELLQNSRQREASLRKQLLQRNCENYIKTQGDAFGLRIRAVSVELRPGEDESWLPYSTYLEAEGDTQEMERLCHLIRDELGIPVERQVWSTDG